MAEFLKKSGTRNIWIDTPVTHKHQYVPLWLSKPSEHITTQQARQQAEKLGVHFGIIRKKDAQDKWTYALRVAPSELQNSKKKLDMNVRMRWQIQGPPAHIGRSQIQDIVKQVEWGGAEILPDRRWFRGAPTWQAVSDGPPPCQETYVQIGYERCWLRIKSTKKQAPALEKTPPATPATPPATWRQATRGPDHRPRTLLQGMSGKGRGGDSGQKSAPGNGPNLATPCATASGEDGNAAKRRKQDVQVTGPRPTPVAAHAVPNPPTNPQESLQAKVTQLEDAMKRIETLLTQVMQHPSQLPGGRGQPSQPEAGVLRGGADVDMEQKDPIQRERERSPRRGDQQQPVS